MAVPSVGWKKVFKGLKLSVQPSRNEGNKAPTLRYNGSQRGRYFILIKDQLEYKEVARQ